MAAVEAFDECILGGLARCNVMPVDPGVLNPSRDGHAGEFGAIVRHNRSRPPALGDDPVQLPCDPQHDAAGNRPSTLGIVLQWRSWIALCESDIIYNILAIPGDAHACQTDHS